jgi:signal transduction histidine kinase
MLTPSELWLFRLMGDRGQSLLDADCLLIVVDEGSELRIAAAAGEVSPRVRMAPRRGTALGALFERGQAQSLERPRGNDAAWLVELGLQARSILIQPLAAAGGERERHEGLVIALRLERSFKPADREALGAFASSLAQRLAAERAVEVERLRFGIQARERERARWAREIHDESIQGIGALRLRLANARDVDDPEALKDVVADVLEGLGHEIDGLRHLITELRPAALDDLGLAAALEALARRAQAIDGLDVRTEIDLPPAERLGDEIEGTVYRVLQEALTNVARHAQATSAVIAVHARDGRLVASVTDDGIGLPEADRLGPREDGLAGGFGMSGMAERAELVGGELSFEPAPGGGTTVSLTVELAPSAQLRQAA